MSSHPVRKILITMLSLTLLILADSSAFAQQGIAINAGLSGSWANPAIPGQGIFTDVDPANRTVFMAWFTYGDTPDDAESVIGAASNRWYVAVGEYAEGSAAVEMALSETEGGIFDDPAAVSEQVVGNLTLSFANCTDATMEFTFDDGGPQGQIALTRLTPGEICEALSD